MEIWQIIIIPIFSTLGGIIGSSGFWAFVMSRSNNTTASQQILVGLAHDAIISRCAEYIDRGFIYNDELDELKKDLYDPYRALGGNGTAEKAYNDVLKLPMKFR